MLFGRAMALGTMVVLSGCALFSPVPAPVVGVDYPATQEDVTPELKGDVLRLGETQLAPWLYAVPDCDSCQLKVVRKEYPEGADLTLSLNDEQGRLRWFLVQSQQYRGRIPDGWFAQGADGVWLTLKGGTHLLPPETKLEHRGCRYQLLEYRRFDRTKKPGEIRDDARQRMQLVGECPANS